jgi:hypothetical protein
MEVPQLVAGLPRMMLSDTPRTESLFPNAEASNRWSVVFSKDANMRTLSFIFETPNRVIPRTCPCERMSDRYQVQAYRTHFVGHDISEEHYMSWINVHAVLRHGILYFVDDGPSSRLYAQHLFYLDDMVGHCMLANDPESSHDFLQTIALNDQLLVPLLSPRVVSFLDVDDGPLDRRYALSRVSDWTRTGSTFCTFTITPGKTRFKLFN